MIRVALAVVAAVSTATFAQAQSSSGDIAHHAIHRRAVEVIIWGMPAVNAELMFQAMKDTNADFDQVVYWSRPLSWKNQTLTPNPDTIYVFPFFNTKDIGPMVLEMPPASEGLTQRRSPATSLMPGGGRWKMLDRPARTSVTQGQPHDDET
jgi:hypothetical protein